MGLETGSYPSDLVATNPTGTDPKSQGDDHIRLIKAVIKATFPNVAGPITPTHTVLNYMLGVTSPVQTQLNTKGAHAGQTWTGAHDFTGAAIIVPTAAGGDADTSPASTAFVDTWFAKKASPALTGTPTAPTAAPGTNTTQIATTAFATQLAFQAALPVQTGAAGKYLQTDGSAASWQNITNSASAKSSSYTVVTTDRYKHFVLSSSGTLSLPAAASAGDGFILYVKNASTGVWTIDPNGAETIDGRATLKMYQREGFAIISDGSAWRTFGRQSRVLISSTTIGAAVASVDFEAGFDDSEFASFELLIDEISGDTNGWSLALKTKRAGAYGGSAVQLSNNSGAIASTVNSRVLINHPFSTAAYGPALSYTSSASGGVEDVDLVTEAATGALEGVRIQSVIASLLDAGTLRFFGVR